MKREEIQAKLAASITFTFGDNEQLCNDLLLPKEKMMTSKAGREIIERTSNETAASIVR